MVGKHQLMNTHLSDSMEGGEEVGSALQQRIYSITLTIPEL